MAPTALARFRSAINPPVETGIKRVWLGWTMALVATFSFSIAPPIAKAAITAGLTPTALLVARFLISTSLLAGSIALMAPGRLRMDRRGAWIAGAAGAMNSISMLTFFWALTRIDASVASMIFSINPLVVLGLLALRGEKFTQRHTVRLALSLAGVYLLIGPGGQVDWTGVLLVLITVFAFAVHLVVIQWFLQNYDAWTVTLYTVTAMTVVIVGFWLVTGAEWRDPDWLGWLAVCVLAIISTYLARLALFAGVRNLGSGQMALLIPLETLLTVIWSTLFLQERLTFWQWIGGGLILSSALLAVRRLRLARWRPRWRAWSRL